jgi:hypothetical protein
LGAQVLISVWETRSDTRHASSAFLSLVVFGPVVMVTLTLVGLPLMALLRRFRAASVLGVTITSSVVVISLGRLAGENLLASFVVGCLLGTGFALAARFPLLRSASMRANYRWSGP